MVASKRYLSDSKVGDFEGLVGSQKEILRFDVFVDDSLTVQILNAFHQITKISGNVPKSSSHDISKKQLWKKSLPMSLPNWQAFVWRVVF